ncbi:hypothetical protein EDB85DRAFT_767247 [Lactarius pseudohatsudake]|nr:hypothetical protein EDB85DRAFT_767247 [Lactarius pseudohatsudake]
MWRAKMFAELCLATTGVVKQDADENQIDQDWSETRSRRSHVSKHLSSRIKECQNTLKSVGKKQASYGSLGSFSLSQVVQPSSRVVDSGRISRCVGLSPIQCLVDRENGFASFFHVHSPSCFSTADPIITTIRATSNLRPLLSTVFIELRRSQHTGHIFGANDDDWAAYCKINTAVVSGSLGEVLEDDLTQLQCRPVNDPTLELNTVDSRGAFFSAFGVRVHLPRADR